MKYQNHEQREIAGRQGRTLRRVLFVCQDNYALSRFAEEYFNSLVRQEGLNWQAASRALATELPAQQDAMDPTALAALRERRAPISLTWREISMSDVLIGIAFSDLHAGSSQWSSSICTERWEPLPSHRDTSAIWDFLTFNACDLLEALELQNSASAAAPRAAGYPAQSIEHGTTGAAA